MMRLDLLFRTPRGCCRRKRRVPARGSVRAEIAALQGAAGVLDVAAHGGHRRHVVLLHDDRQAVVQLGQGDALRQGGERCYTWRGRRVAASGAAGTPRPPRRSERTEKDEGENKAAGRGSAHGSFLDEVTRHHRASVTRRVTDLTSSAPGYRPRPVNHTGWIVQGPGTGNQGPGRAPIVRPELLRFACFGGLCHPPYSPTPRGVPDPLSKAAESISSARGPFSGPFAGKMAILLIMATAWYSSFQRPPTGPAIVPVAPPSGEEAAEVGAAAGSRARLSPPLPYAAELERASTQDAVALVAEVLQADLSGASEVSTPQAMRCRCGSSPARLDVKPAEPALCASTLGAGESMAGLRWPPPSAVAATICAARSGSPTADFEPGRRRR